MKKFFTFISICMIAFNTIHAKITWTLSNGTLTISGTDMPNYQGDSKSPWFSQRSKIKKVVIENGVTNIGNYAFKDCSNLTSITIPNSVTSIRDRTFYCCSGLTSLSIPNSVTSIGDRAFYCCSGLTSLSIPNSVTNIGGHAFYCCSGLTSLSIPNSVTNIGGYAFYSCDNIASMTIRAAVPPAIAQGTFGNETTYPIYVPAESVSIYQSTWSNYASRIRAIT